MAVRLVGQQQTVTQAIDFYNTTTAD